MLLYVFAWLYNRTIVSLFRYAHSLIPSGTTARAVPDTRSFPWFVS